MIRVFYGADTYRSRAAFRGARERAARVAGGKVVALRDEALTPHAFQEAIEGQSLFGGYPPIAVERLTDFSGNSADAAVAVLRRLPEGRELLVWEEGVPSATSVVWRALSAAADELSECALLAEAEVLQWVQRRALEAGRTVEAAAAHELSAACGADLWSLSAELEKLFLLRAQGPLTVDDVRTVTSFPTLADVYGAVDAFLRNDSSSALQRLAASRRAGEDLRRLLSLVLRDLRRLLSLRDGLDHGEVPSAWSIARELHLPRAAAEHLLQAARQTTTARLQSLLDRCAVAYYHLNTGRAEPDEVLEGLVWARAGW